MTSTLGFSMKCGNYSGPQRDRRAQESRFRALLATTRLFSIPPLMALSGMPTYARVLYGTLVGKVTDVSGAEVPRAKVKITQVETNKTFSTATNFAGLFTLTDMPTETYDITFAAQGFATSTAPKIPVAFNTIVRVDATLQVGTQRPQATVSAQAAALQTDRADTHADVTGTEFVDMPQLPRTYERLLGVLAGVYPPSASSVEPIILPNPWSLTPMA